MDEARAFRYENVHKHEQNGVLFCYDFSGSDIQSSLAIEESNDHLGGYSDSL